MTPGIDHRSVTGLATDPVVDKVERFRDAAVESTGRRMMATREIELERYAAGTGCLGKAAPDEPLFILRAQDRLAPIVVQLWAQMADLVGSPKSLEAAGLAAAMLRWQHAHPDKVKWPD
jgi:hypothetical protein